MASLNSAISIRFRSVHCVHCVDFAPLRLFSGAATSREPQNTAEREDAGSFSANTDGDNKKVNSGSKRSLLQRMKNYASHSRLGNVLSLQERKERRKTQTGRSKEDIDMIRIRTEQRRIGLEEKARITKAEEERVSKLQIHPYASAPVMDIAERIRLASDALSTLPYASEQSDWRNCALNTDERRFFAMKAVYKTTGIRIPDVTLERCASMQDVLDYLEEGTDEEYLTLRERRATKFPPELLDREKYPNVEFMGRLRAAEARVGGQYRLYLEGEMDEPTNKNQSLELTSSSAISST